jgi:hypothetical protein
MDTTDRVTLKMAVEQVGKNIERGLTNIGESIKEGIIYAADAWREGQKK